MLPTLSSVACFNAMCFLSFQMASIYGDVYTLWLGHTPIIVLNGFQAVKEVLINHSEDFADRPLQPFLEDLLGGAQGICQ